MLAATPFELFDRLDLGMCKKEEQEDVDHDGFGYHSDILQKE